MSRLTRSLLGAAIGALSAVGVLAPAPAVAAGHAAGRSAMAVTRTTAAPSTGRGLRLVLPLVADTAGLERFATAVSTPGSGAYRHYRSISWLAAHFGAPPRARSRVSAYLRAHGARQIHVDRTGLFIDATVSAPIAETLFRTNLRRFHARSGAYLAQAAPVQIPAALRGAVSGVVGLDTQPVLTGQSFASRRALAPGTAATASSGGGSNYRPVSGTPKGCRAATAVDAFTPNQYLSAYGYGGLQAAGTLGQGERVALIEVDGFHRSDISAFARCFGVSVPKLVAFRTNAQVARAGLPAGGEATLDIEVLAAAAPKLSEIDVYESTADIAGVLQSLTAPLQNSGYKPEVISASLGLCEPQVRAAVGVGGIRDTEAALAEAAASGISVLAASGDDGSADCVNSVAPSALPLPQLAVNYPASSPWVTSVGGTNMTLTAANTILSQDVWNDGANNPGAAGGGGFSKLFSRPSYQSGVVAPDARALPDVAALADIQPGYVVYCTAAPECVSPGATDPWQAVGGTSASTPLLAGGLALIDQLLREHKQQSLGLVNPLLYQLGTHPASGAGVFSDVTLGSNDVGPFIRSSHAPLGCCTAGLGFDEASGWGSVDVNSLARAALAAAPAIVDVAQSVPRGQHPLSSAVIVDRVSCSGACQIGAYAKIAIAGAASGTLYSGLYHLTAAGTKLIRIPLDHGELTKLRSALADHRRVTAAVVGAIVDPAGNVERRTPATSVTLSR